MIGIYNWIMDNTNRCAKFAPVFVRFAISLVVLWFGVNQLSNPEQWISQLPEWTTQLPVSQVGLIYFNGWFELVFGLTLFFGFYTRLSAFFIAIHLLHITITVGYSASGVRDFGLAISALSVFLSGSDIWSVDKVFEKETV